MNINELHRIYFIGIGGIGMSALARFFKGRGVDVSGYDRTATELTQALESEGIPVHFEDDPGQIPEAVDLVIWTPAVPADHKELNALRQRGIPMMKRAEVLGHISRGLKAVAVAGTHGKTTTSTLIAYLLRAGGVDASAFLGGISLDLNGNFVQGKSDWVVTEADEYDRSFLHLHPMMAVINSIDPDHLDIYGSAGAVRESYRQFALQVTQFLLLRHGIDLDVLVEFRREEIKRFLLTFGIDEGDCRASNLRVEDGFMVFDWDSPFGGCKDLRFPFPGRHNVENAVAALTIAAAVGADIKNLPTALAAFKGIHRRFEYIVRRPDLVYVDDYAHHPAELEATIAAARMLFPGRKITGIFQPHLYSRTRDFAEGFAAALDKLDEAILLPIYPARELPMAGVSAQMVLDKMALKNKSLIEKTAIPDALKNRRVEVLLTLGAGDIDTLVDPIKQFLETNP